MKILRKDDGSGSKSKTFVKAVEELAKDPAATLRIYERSGLKGKYLAEVPIADALEFARSCEESLKGEFGGGAYQIALCDRDTEVKARYSFDIAGPPKGRRSPNDESARARGAASPYGEMLTTIMGKLADAAISNKSSSTDEWQRTLELAKALKGDDGMERELIPILLNHVLQGGGSTLDEAVTLIELMQRLQPQQQDEGWGQLVPMVTSLLTSFRGGQAAPTPQQAQEIQALKQQLQSLASGAVGAPGAVAEQPPAPGASASGGGLAGSVQSAASPTPSVREGTEAYFHERFVNPFRRDVAAGEEVCDNEGLAYQIATMYIYARDRMPGNPPAIMADFLSATTMPEYLAALQRFFAAIPELANLTQKQIAIRTVLMMKYTPVFQQSPAEEVQDRQEPDSIIHIEQDQVVDQVNLQDAEPGSIEATESAEETAHEDQADIAAGTSEVEHETVSSEV